MTAQELREVVRKFADRAADIDMRGNRLLAEIHGSLIEVELVSRNHQLFCVEGGREESAETWIVRRLGCLELLANRILEFLPEDSRLVPVAATVVQTLDLDESQEQRPVKDVVRAMQGMLGNMPPASTNIVYLTSDAGEGKTCVIESLARRQARAYLDGTDAWLVLPVSLGGRPFLRLDEVIVGSLANRLRFQMLYYEGVLELVKRGAIVLALDGFEEMFVEAQTGEVASSLGNLVGKLESQGTLLFAARKAYYEYTSLSTQARLFNTIKDGSVAFAEVRLARWKDVQFQQCCELAGFTPSEAQRIYDAFQQRLTATHPVLTRAVLARKAIEEVFADNGTTGLADIVGTGDPSPEATFGRFVEALIRREATEKWIDRSGEAARPLLSEAEHDALLISIAEEMWMAGTDVLPWPTLDSATELCVEAMGHLASVSGQARERVRQHALLQKAQGNEAYGFDHDEFRAFFIGKRLGSLIASGTESELRRFLGMRALPDLSVRVACRTVCDMGLTDRAVSVLKNLACQGMKTSFSCLNASSLTIRMLGTGKSRGVELVGMHFTPESVCGLALNGTRFVQCTFERLCVDGTELSDVHFRECRVAEVVAGVVASRWQGEMDRESLPEVVRVGGGDESVSYYAPVKRAQVMEKIGVTLNEPSRDGQVNETVPCPEVDPRIIEIERVVRAFRRATAINEGVMRTRLGRMWSTFDRDVLPVLLREGVVLPVAYDGGGQQRRFRLGIGFDAVERARKRCGGDYATFIAEMKR